MPSSTSKANVKPKPNPPQTKTNQKPIDSRFQEKFVPSVKCVESSPNIYTKFYKPGSTELRSASVAKRWEGSGMFFTSFMTNKYIPQVQKSSTSNNAFVFLSKPNQSIISQIKGACDVLLLAILNKRPFKCSHCTPLSHLSRLRQSASPPFLQLPPL